RLATVDSLTQIPNRRYFDERLQAEWNRLAREIQPLSLILFDVDFFKQFNDYYGHLAGDMCLIQIAKVASRSISRPADFVARYGGEEFVIVLPNTQEQGAIQIAKKLIRNLQKESIIHEKSSVSKKVTVSIGIASLIPTHEKSCEELIQLADKALYDSKESGRNKYSIS
ncbi:MAG TPA: GGDEF domain-containing protein, partial [Leptospiraceae bacterium]|nr:GGDEF domain-containing protein [Leptospiraceae bacterium]